MTCPARHYSIGPCHLDAGHLGNHENRTGDDDVLVMRWRNLKPRTNNVSFHVDAELSAWLSSFDDGNRHATAKAIVIEAMRQSQYWASRAVVT